MPSDNAVPSGLRFPCVSWLDCINRSTARAVCVVFAMALAFQAGELRAAAVRPNIVWLVSEDSSVHYLQLFHDRGAETKHIAALARDGLRFEHAFSNAPVCSVARTTLMSGCYAPRLGAQFHRRIREVPLPGALRLFPAYLREAGYYTTNRQKKDYNVVEGQGVWDASSGRASWRNRGEGQPFFHMQSFGVTHEGSLHFTAEQMRAEATVTDPASITLPAYHPDTEVFRYTHARYHDRIREMDEQIGSVVRQLDEDGLLEDTFVFYFGDHGGVLPRSKGYVYESGLHVPLVVRVPEKWRDEVEWPVGGRATGFVSFVDFAPTVLHLAGVPVPSEMDGQPFLGDGITLQDVNERDETFGYADRFDEKYDFVRSVRKGRFKYIRNFQPFQPDALRNNYRYRMLAHRQWSERYREGRLSKEQSQFFESRPAEMLFDLEADPDEVNNLAGNSAYREQLLDLRRRLRERMESLPDLSLLPESELVESEWEDGAGYGDRHRDQLSRLLEVADLQLVDWADARERLRSALASADAWQRYWALIACSAHGPAARELLSVTRSLEDSDPELLVRLRALEFRGLVDRHDPVSAGEVAASLTSLLAQTRSPVEALMMLNTVVLLRDQTPGIDVQVEPSALDTQVRSQGEVTRRLDYLNAGDANGAKEHPGAATVDAVSTKPNVVIILADDMGYGDVQALEAESRIPTPSLNRLAREGMTMTDAHSPSAVCTPTRYGLLTGRYCWRTSLKSGVLGGYSRPLLERQRVTLPEMMRAAGYQTAAIGKWHLGMELPLKQGDANVSVWQGDPGIDFGGVITDSPIHHGFDYYFGVSASLDMAPYVYIRNDRFTQVPTLQQAAVPFPHFVRQGPRAEDFQIEGVLDRLVDEATGFIRRAAQSESPFLLYFPLTAPHKPTQPHPRFRGKSGLGEYGDFVMQVDEAVGRVLESLEESGVADKTLIVYSSDNGSYMFRLPEDVPADHVQDPAAHGYRGSNHRANGPWRGTKADIWEAGHRVPLLVRWPGVVSHGARSDATVCLTDLFATLAEAVGQPVDTGTAEDSESMWAAWKGDASWRRAVPVVHHSVAGMFAVRDGRWKLVAGNGSGGREKPTGKPFEPPYQLFDLQQDPAEANDVAAQYPDQVSRLTAALEAIRNAR
jgi:arylsulfatase A-like enzyme